MWKPRRAPTTLDRYRESVRQVAVADDIVVDEAGPRAFRLRDATRAPRLREINPGARIWQATLADTPDLVEAFTTDAHDLKDRGPARPMTGSTTWRCTANGQGHAHETGPGHITSSRTFRITTRT